MGRVTSVAWQLTVAAEALEHARRVVDRESAPIARLHEPHDAVFLKGGRAYLPRT